MNNEFDDLKNQWKAARSEATSTSPSFENILKKAESKRKSSLYFQYGNIIILSLVLVGIILCFIYLFPFQETFSRIGVGIMFAGLGIRIGVEIFSVIKAKAIRMTDSLAATTNHVQRYYAFRKRVNGPVTVSLVVAYIIGVFMLTPEFVKYVDPYWMGIFDGGFLIAAVLLIWQIGKGIRKEMKDLEEIVKLQNTLNKNGA